MTLSKTKNDIDQRLNGRSVGDKQSILVLPPNCFLCGFGIYANTIDLLQTTINAATIFEFLTIFEKWFFLFEFLKILVFILKEKKSRKIIRKIGIRRNVKFTRIQPKIILFSSFHYRGVSLEGFCSYSLAGQSALNLKNQHLKEKFTYYHQLPKVLPFFTPKIIIINSLKLTFLVRLKEINFSLAILEVYKSPFTSKRP